MTLRMVAGDEIATDLFNCRGIIVCVCMWKKIEIRLTYGAYIDMISVPHTHTAIYLEIEKIGAAFTSHWLHECPKE